VKGSTALFAVSEVYHGKYAIVNHTRNTKGFVSLSGDGENYKLKQGQLIIGTVLAEGTGVY